MFKTGKINEISEKLKNEKRFTNMQEKLSHIFSIPDLSAELVSLNGKLKLSLLGHQ